MVKQSRNRDRGKDAERAVAKMLGGKRIGLMGGEDVFHPTYSIEVKSTKSFVGRKWMLQCIKNNKDNKIPMVVVHQANTRHEDDLVMIRMKDFKRID